MFVQRCGCTCCKEKEDEDGFYRLNIEDEVATDLVGELETENFEGDKQRTSSLNFSNDDVPKYYERDPYNFMIELPPYAWAGPCGVHRYVYLWHC